MVALAHAGGGARRRSLAGYDRLAGEDPRLAELHGSLLSEMIKVQSGFMKSAPEAALSALTRMLPTHADRQHALAIVSSLIIIDEADADDPVVRMRDAIAAVMAVQPDGCERSSVNRQRGMMVHDHWSVRIKRTCCKRQATTTHWSDSRPRSPGGPADG